jgi:ribosomal protein L17
MTTESGGSTEPVTAVLVSQLPPHYLQRGGGYIPIG